MIAGNVLLLQAPPGAGEGEREGLENVPIGLWRSEKPKYKYRRRSILAHGKHHE